MRVHSPGGPSVPGFSSFFFFSFWLGRGGEGDAAFLFLSRDLKPLLSSFSSGSLSPVAGDRLSASSALSSSSFTLAGCGNFLLDAALVDDASRSVPPRCFLSLLSDSSCPSFLRRLLDLSRCLSAVSLFSGRCPLPLALSTMFAQPQSLLVVSEVQVERVVLQLPLPKEVKAQDDCPPRCRGGR